MTDIIENLKEQNRIMKNTLLFIYDHKLRPKTIKEQIERNMEEVTKLERKLIIKVVK